EPRKPASAAAASRLNLARAAKTAQATRPINKRGRIDTVGSLKKGTVARVKLRSPKTIPETIPTSGPAMTPPRMVGICSVVALPTALGRGIKPRPGTTPRIIVIAASTPVIAMRSVVIVQGLVVAVVRVVSCLGGVSRDSLLKISTPLWEKGRGDDIQCTQSTNDLV